MRTTVLAVFVFLLATSVAAQAASDSTVRIRSLRLIGNPGLSTQQERALTARLRTLEYSSDFATEIAERTRFALQDHGYFKSIVHDPRITTVQTLPGRKIVDVVIAVESGSRYRLGTISFEDQTAFSESELRSQFHIAAGSLFNRTAIGKGLENLRMLYCRKGYANFTSVPDTAVDESKHTVSLLISIDEGQPYRYGKLTVSGEESVAGAKQKLSRAWRPYEGKLYDCSNDALKAYFHDLHLRPDLQPYQFIETSFDNSSHLVNLQIRLARPPFPMAISRTRVGQHH